MRVDIAKGRNLRICPRSTSARGQYLHRKKPIYKLEAAKGMPVSIQIACKKWEAENVLKIREVFDEVLSKGRGFGPGS